ncbi:diguanylate cyclase [Pseudomonas aeruginosa PA38182]|nr:diguanylate cyclase [Pseudomonas aeruginosa PA38182]
MLACPLPPDEALRQQALDDMALVDTPAEHYLDAWWNWRGKPSG